MQAELSKLMLLSDYRELRQHIFPSQSSLDWFLRTHRAGLVEEGALLLLTGRWFVNPERFDAGVLKTGCAAAKAHAGSSNQTDLNGKTDAGDLETSAAAHLLMKENSG